MTVDKIENGLECGFVKRCLNCLLITDPRGVYGGYCEKPLESKILGAGGPKRKKTFLD